MTMNIYYKQSDITTLLSELMLSPWALECDSTRAAGIQEALHLIQDMINGEVPENMKIPAADVKPVMRGEWVPGKEIARTMLGNETIVIEYENWHCSKCGVVVEDWEFPRYKYCPACGADMRRANDDHTD